MTTLTVRTAAGNVLCERCAVADNPWTRLRGLLGRNDLPAGEGLWIRPTFSIHMMFMRFAIDAVFLDREDTVVRIVPDLQPGKAATHKGARSVIELRAGECERRGLAVGDRLVAEPA